MSDEQQARGSWLKRREMRHENLGPNGRGLNIVKVAGTILGFALSLGLFAVAVEVGAQKEKISQLEQARSSNGENVRRLEQRIDDKVRQLEKKIDETDDKVQKILEAVGEIRGELRAARRRAGE